MLIWYGWLAGSQARNRAMNISSSGMNSMVSKKALFIKYIQLTQQQRESFTVYEYRAGSPALAPLPMINRVIGQNVETLRNLEENRYDIEIRLRGAGVTIHAVQFIYRYIPGRSPGHDNITIFVRASWEEDSMRCWMDACQILRNFLDTIQRPDVKIEIIANELCDTKYMDVVDVSHPFVHVWKTTVKERVCDILSRSEIKDNLTAINVIRLGRRDIPSQNPITVLVSTDYETYPFQ